MWYWLSHPESDSVYYSETILEEDFQQWVCELSDKWREDTLKDLVRCLYLEGLKNHSQYTSQYIQK